MAHQSQVDYCLSVKSRFPGHFRRKSVLDAGSLDINGNNRYLFDDCQYVGIDVWAWKNVDVVCSAHEFDGWPFDTVISTEMLEHNRFWEESLRNLLRLLKPGGLFVLTCAGYWRKEHWTTRTSPADAPFTNDFYRNVLLRDLSSWIYFDEEFSEYEVSKYGEDIRFYGIKRLDIPA